MPPATLGRPPPRADGPGLACGRLPWMPGSSPGMTVWVVDSGLRAFPAIPSPPGRDRVGGRGVGDRGSEALGIDRDIAYRQALAQLQESAGRHQAAGARALQEVDVEIGRAHV